MRGVTISVVGELKVISLPWNDSIILIKITAVTLTLCLSDFMSIKTIRLACVLLETMHVHKHINCISRFNATMMEHEL